MLLGSRDSIGDGARRGDLCTLVAAWRVLTRANLDRGILQGSKKKHRPAIQHHPRSTSYLHTAPLPNLTSTIPARSVPELFRVRLVRSERAGGGGLRGSINVGGLPR